MVQYIGKLDKNKLGKYKNKIITEDVIITEERIQHILEKHKEDYTLYKDKLKDIIEIPQYVLEDIKNEDTVFLIDKIEKGNINVVIRLNLIKDKKHPQNSIITMWRIRDKNLKRLINKNKIIYKRE